MATNLSGVLASVPGLAGYLAKQQLDQQQEMGQVQQLGALAQLQAQMQNQQAQAQTRQRQEAARQALAGLGPDATEDQRVQALLPHIGDPDKIAGILQNASLRKAQQAQTREIAAQNLSQRLATEARHAYEFAQTLPLKERQVALQEINTRLNAAYKQGMLRLSAGEAQWSRGEDVSPIMDYLNTMRGLVASPSASQGASPGQAAPTPQPAPSAAPAPSEAPGGAVPGPMMDSSGLGKLTPDQLAMGIQEAIVSGGQYPNDPAHKAAYDRFVAEAQRRGMSVNAPFPQAAPSAAVPAPTAAPQAAPQPAPQAAPQAASQPAAASGADLPDWIKSIQSPKEREKEAAKWRADEEKRRRDGADPNKDPFKKAAFNAGLQELKRDETALASVNQLETSLKRWQELNSQVETGRAVGMRPGIGQPLFQEMLRLQNDLAVNNFKPGQGQISNFERGLIKGAGPQVTNDKEANDNIVNVMLGAVQNARERGMFREAYLEKNRSLIGADKVWNEYIEKNPRFVSGPNGSLVPNQNRKDWTTLIGGAPQVQATSQPAPAGVDPKIWAAMTPEERALWK